jgi:type I restriction enzyme, R subunit
MPKTFNEIFANFNSVMSLLMNDDFQHLLENYERAKKVFMIGYEIKDNVTSQDLFAADGKSDLKPEDYLNTFNKFVKDNEKKIEAIGILLNRPKRWNTNALNELRIALSEKDFEVEKLQKAHKIVYHKDLVDIISMIKHAANQEATLYSVNERVEYAISKVFIEKELTDEQSNWVNYIKEHLMQNFTIDEHDLKELPIFVDRGGFNKFKKVFPGDYRKIIKEINNAIAA